MFSLLPPATNPYSWYRRTTSSLGSATALKIGCASHFLMLVVWRFCCCFLFYFLWPAKKGPPLHPPLSQRSARLRWRSRSQGLAGSCKPRPWPQSFLEHKRPSGLLAADISSLSWDRLQDKHRLHPSNKQVEPSMHWLLILTPNYWICPRKEPRCKLRHHAVQMLRNGLMQNVVSTSTL